MLTLLKIAIRNINRNTRRSILCIFAIAVAVFFMITMISYINGMLDSLQKVIKTFEIGDISIYSKDFDEKKDFFPLQYPIETNQNDLDQFLDQIETINGVKAAYPRITSFATLTSNMVKHAILWGIDTDQEMNSDDMLRINDLNLKDKSNGLLLGHLPGKKANGRFKNECLIGIEMAKKINLIPMIIEVNEFNWFNASLSGEQTLLFKKYYQKKQNKPYYKLIEEIEYNDRLKLYELFIEPPWQTIPQKIGQSSNLMDHLKNRLSDHSYFVDAYDYNEETQTYRLKKEYAGDEKLLNVIRKNIRFNIPMKIVSSNFSDVFYNPTVTGIFDFDYANFDINYIILPFERMQRLARLHNKTQTIYVYLDQKSDLNQVNSEISALINRDDVMTNKWNTHFFVTYLKTAQIMYMAVYCLFIILASFLIINTIVMVIHERIKEIGMMGALGMKKGEIIMVFFLEAICLSVLGSIVGTIIGGLVTLALSYYPIDLLALSGGMDMPLSNTIFIKFSYFHLLQGLFFGIIVSACCTIFPSIKSAFIEPVEAIRK